ncbi:unnamed protein product, partial [Adineta steineri]
MLKRQIGNRVVASIMSIATDTYPLLLCIMLQHGQLQITNKIRGTMSCDEVYEELVSAHDKFNRRVETFNILEDSSLVSNEFLTILLKSSAEYVEIANKLAISHRRILRVYNIDVLDWLKDYTHQKTIIDARIGHEQTELLLFHGCTPSAADSIIQHRFDHELIGLHGAYYGHGFYFSSCSYTSQEYAKADLSSKESAILICRVIVGESCIEADALLLVEQNLGRGYWFPFDEIKSSETRALAAKRITSKICPYDFELVNVIKIRCSDLLPCLPSTQTYYLLTKGRLNRGNGSTLVNSIWMNFERMKTAVKNRELLGLEPFYLLKTIIERQQANGWDDFISGGQIFEEPILQFIDCKQPDPNNQLIASPQEQLMGSAKFNTKLQERIFKEFYSYTFPSEYMSYQAFTEAMDNKLSTVEKTKMQAYFRAFDAQQKSYLTYSDYLLGLAAMDPSTSHGGAPAEQRCRYIFRFYNIKNNGNMSVEEFR